MNLARALRLAGDCAEAVRQYRELEEAQDLRGYPEERCSYAEALTGSAEWQEAERVLRSVIDDDDTPRKVWAG